MTAKKWSEVRRSKVPDEAAAAESARALRDALDLAQIRQARGLTQVQLAERMHIRQASVSAMERRDDVYLSSLRDYVAALGGELELTAVFGEERIPVVISAHQLASANERTLRRYTPREAG